jgi:hypothetical protein
MTTINAIIKAELLTYITDNDIITYNFDYIEELVNNYNGNIRYGLIEYFTNDEEGDVIVNELYNNGEGLLSNDELNNITKNSDEVIEIYKYVFEKKREYNDIENFGDIMGTYKIYDAYMYFKAKEIMDSYDHLDDNEEFWDELVYIYEKEVLAKNIIKVSRNIAVNKIKRNRLYNLGLGLKLAVKAYSKEF